MKSLDISFKQIVKAKSFFFFLSSDAPFFFIFTFIYFLLLFFWLLWVFVVVCGLLSRCGFSLGAGFLSLVAARRLSVEVRKLSSCSARA